MARTMTNGEGALVKLFLRVQAPKEVEGFGS